MTVQDPRTHAPPLATATIHSEGGLLTVVLRGELDLHATPSVLAAITAALVPDVERVRIDLTDLTFCDSSGIAMLFGLRRRSLEENFDLTLTNPSRTVLRTIELCDPSGALPVIGRLPASAVD